MCKNVITVDLFGVFKMATTSFNQIFYLSPKKVSEFVSVMEKRGTVPLVEGFKSHAVSREELAKRVKESEKADD